MRLIDVNEAKKKLRAVQQWFVGNPSSEQDKLAQAVAKMCIDEIDEIKPVDAVVLPCKIGEKVFCILHSKNEIVEDVVEDYDIWSIKNGIKLRISLLNHNDYVVREFGKTVFLTREEAEAALARTKE